MILVHIQSLQVFVYVSLTGIISSLIRVVHFLNSQTFRVRLNFVRLAEQPERPHVEAPQWFARLRAATAARDFSLVT